MTSGSVSWPPVAGEMAARVRAFDWSATPLGPIATWPATLKTAVDLMLASPQPVYIAWGPELISLYNDGYIPIAGDKHPASLGMPYRLMWPEIWDEFRPVAAAVMAGEARFFEDQPVPLASRPGRPMSWFTFSWTPLRDEAGNVAGFYCAAVETTDRVLADQERDRNYRALFEAIDEGYLLAEVIFDDAGKAIDIAYLDANPAATRMVGTDLKGRRLREVSPDYEEYWYEIWGRVARTGVGERLERHAAPEGRWYDFYVFKPEPDDVASNRVAVLIHDATERKRLQEARHESEQRLGNVLDGMGEAFGLMDRDLRIITQNKAALQFDWRPLEEIRGRTHWEAYPGSEDSELGRLYKRALAEGVPVSLEHRYRWADGHAKWLEMRAYPVPEGLAVFWHDISDRKAAETALRESEERQAFLLELSDALRPLADAGEIQRVAARMIGEHWGVNANYAPIETYDGVEYFVIQHSYALPGRAKFEFNYPVAEWPGVTSGMLSGVMAVEDVAGDPRLTAAEKTGFATIEVGAYLSAPLVKNGRLDALFSAHATQPRAWTDAEKSMMQEVAERTWAAMERTRAEAALQASEEKFRTVFETIDHAFVIQEIIRDDAGLAIDMRYMEINPAFTRQTGLGPEIVGKLVSEVMPDVERFFIDIHDRVARTGVPERFENYNQSTGRWYDAHITAIGGEGRLAASVFEDVSARKLAEIALRESEERQAFLLKLSDALRPLVDPLDIQHVAMKLLVEQFGVMRAGYLVAADDDENTMIMAAHFERDAQITPERIRLSDYGPDLVDAFRAGRTMVVRDTQADGQTEEQRAAHRAIGIGSWIIAPLRKAGRLIAIVGVVDRAPRDWMAVEVQLITEVAERTWAAVERARAEAALRDNEERQAFLLQLADVLRGLAAPIEIEEQATRLLARQLQVSRAVYATFVVEGDREYVTIEREHRAPGTPSLVGRYPAEAWKDDIDTLRAGRATVIPDIEVEPMSDERRASWQALGARARMGVPLVKGGRLAVVLGVHSAIPRTWTAQDVELVREIGERTWAAVERARAEEALRESEERQAFLLALSDALRPLTDSGEIERTATKLLGEHLQADRCFLSPVYEDGLGMCVREEYLRGDASSVLGDYTFGQFGDFVGPELHAGRILAVEDVSALAGLSAAERASYETVGIGAYLLIPLIRDDRLAAFLTINHQTPRPWSEADKAVARQTADRLWTARERGRAETELRESQARLATELGGTERLRGLAEYLVVEDDADKLHDEILSAAIDLTRADAGTIQLYDPDTRSLVLLVTRNIEPRMTDHFHSVDADSKTACGKALRTGARTFVDFDDETDEACRMHVAAGYRSAQATPLLSRAGEPLGMLNTHWREAGHRPNQRELRFLDLLARQAADLIEQRRTQATLRESEGRLSKLLTLMPVAVYACDTDGRLTFFNRRAVECWGREPKLGDIEDRWCGSLRMWLPDGTPLGHDVCPMVDAVRRGETFRDTRVVIEQPSGARIVASVNIDPLYDADGHLIGAINVFEDITERERAEEALRESETRLRQFGEASQDVLWIRDADTLQWTYLTPAFEAIYGVGREEALAGNNYRSWLELILPEDRRRARAAIERVRQGEHVTFDYRIRRPVDGAIRWLRNTDFPIADATGHVALVGGVGHDLTELREAELRLQMLMEGIPQLVWRAVDGGHWTWASPQWTAFTGQDEPASHGLGWLDPVHPGDRDGVMATWAGAIERGAFHADYRIRHADDGRYRWFQTRATPVRDDDGRIVEWLGTSTDIHDIRELQDQQDVLVAELQHRTRNLMGVVRATFESTLRSGGGLDEFSTAYRDRLGALARVQSLLSRLNNHDRVTFDELIRDEFRAVGALDRVVLAGPPGVALRSSTVQTFAMALHELTTNAVKYGALAHDSGALAVAWRLDREGPDGQPWLHVDWHESGVVMPPTGALPRGTGQGRQLIEKALPYQLGARTSYVMGLDGVRCSIAVPVSSRTPADETAHDLAPAS